MEVQKLSIECAMSAHMILSVSTYMYAYSYVYMYRDLRPAAGQEAVTFQVACRLPNLLEDDDEWDNCFGEAGVFQMPSQIQCLFSTTSAYFVILQTPFSCGKMTIMDRRIIPGLIKLALMKTEPCLTYMYMCAQL